MAPSTDDTVSTPGPAAQPDDAQLQSSPHSTSGPSPESSSQPRTRKRTGTNASTTSVGKLVRTASVKAMEATPPPGMWAATGTTASKAPGFSDIRRGSFSSTGWNEEPQRAKAERRGSSNSNTASESPVRPGLGTTRTSSTNLRATGVEPFPAVTEEDTNVDPGRGSVAQQDGAADPKDGNLGKETGVPSEQEAGSERSEKTPAKVGQQTKSQYANGYIPPPKVPWKTATVIGLKAFWKWFLTIPGFLITLYGLNVVAWGGMLFLLLCNAAPAMCNPTCDDIQSPRRIWIEIDSQILNAFFCVTGFGLAPWRFRDLYWWGWWRLGGSQRKQTGIRRLAGIHRSWFRLPGSDQLPELADASAVNPEDPAVPIPHDKIPDPPPTGIRAPPTKSWKMDFVLWMNAWNTFFQVILSFYMYNYNRYERPSWATGTFVALGCLAAGIGGIMMYHEGKRCKKVEGVPMPKGSTYENGQTDVEAQSAVNANLTSVPVGTEKSS